MISKGINPQTKMPALDASPVSSPLHRITVIAAPILLFLSLVLVPAYWVTFRRELLYSSITAATLCTLAFMACFTISSEEEINPVTHTNPPKVKSPMQPEYHPNPTQNSTELLVPFYTAEGRDAEGRTFKEIMQFNEKMLESQHDYIQWLFPNPGSSRYYPRAPRFVEPLKTNPVAQKRAAAAFDMMLHFYGLRYDAVKEEIVRGPNWEGRKDNWLTVQNHNLQRITRILTFLDLMEMHTASLTFRKQLHKIALDYPKVVTYSVCQFWQIPFDHLQPKKNY